MDLSDSSSAPVIGLTSYLEQAKSGVWDVQASFLPKVYFEAVTKAGGIAVLLPPQPVNAHIAHRILDGLDGLIVTGGKDIEPSRYGQEPHPETDAPRRDRDAFEEALLTAAIAKEIPFLGICRGAQMLNVVRGGDLQQHLPDVVGDRRYQAGNGIFNQVDVSIAPESHLSELIPENGEFAVPVYHHQAIGTVGEGLTVTARTADGTIEAVELDGVPFGVAVQWHPEEDTDDIRLFAGLVKAASEYRSRRQAQANSLSPREESIAS